MRAILTNKFEGVVELDENDHTLKLGIFDAQRLLRLVRFCVDMGYEEVELAVRHGGAANTLLVRPYHAKGEGWLTLAGKREVVE